MVGATTYFPQKGDGHAKGGPVRKTTGKPVGKDDGMIPGAARVSSSSSASRR